VDVLKPARTINYLLYISMFNFFHDFHYDKFVKLTGWHIVVLFGSAFHFQEESSFNLGCGDRLPYIEAFILFLHLLKKNAEIIS